jgi:hypothetical protein
MLRPGKKGAAVQENHRKTNPTIYLWMGLVWIGLALFGLTFDPDKGVIVVSQVIAGVFCLALFLYSRRNR